MSKIVYTDDPSYIAPKDTIVLPLCEHPSIKEDLEKGFSNKEGKHFKSGLEQPGFRAIEIVENIKNKGYATAKELSEEMGITRQSVNLTILRHPNLIVPIGKTGKQGNEMLFSIQEWENQQ